MGVEKRKQFMETVTGNELVVKYVKLFRMPLFLTVLDEEFGKMDDSVWDKEETAQEAAFKVMPGTLRQFSFPQEEIDQVIGQCVKEYVKTCLS